MTAASDGISTAAAETSLISFTLSCLAEWRRRAFSRARWETGEDCYRETFELAPRNLGERLAARIEQFWRFASVRTGLQQLDEFNP